MQTPIDDNSRNHGPAAEPCPDAGQLLEGAVRDYRTGEMGYCQALLDAGRKAHRYLLLCIAQAGTPQAVDLLAGDTDVAAVSYYTLRAAA